MIVGLFHFRVLHSINIHVSMVTVVQPMENVKFLAIHSFEPLNVMVSSVYVHMQARNRQHDWDTLKMKQHPNRILFRYCNNTTIQL